MSPNARGAVLMMGSMAAFTLNDTCMKLVMGHLPLFQLLVLRGALASILIYALARYLGALTLRFPRRDRGLVALRCLAEVGATFFFLTALSRMPLANVTAVLQTAPLTVTLGAAIFLGEPVGWRRFAAIAAGFLGMLLIVRPGPEGFSVEAAYVLIAVCFVTLRDLTTRRMSASVPSLTVTLAAALSVTAFAAIMSVGAEWVPMSGADLALVCAASVLILGGYLFAVMVMRVGEISFIAPFRYTGLIWALVLGYAVFGHWPEPLTLVGAGIVAAAGLFTFYRERRLPAPAKT